MTRDEWKARSREFERSASTLLASAHYDVAYHLAGVAVECALKAKIATQFRTNDLPDKKLVDDIYRSGHDLVVLVRLAELDAVFANAGQTHPAFQASWSTVRMWTVNSRYRAWSQLEATEMVAAATRRGTGVLPWVRRYWQVRISTLDGI